MLQAVVLGSGAGGGVPQWNCGCAMCTFARAGDGGVSARTQACVAFTADGEHWTLAGAPPDLRTQIERTPALHPRGLRHSPITDVVLLSAEVDGIAGLLSLRERQPFRLLAPDAILRTLASNPIFDVLDPALVVRLPVRPGVPEASGGGLSLTLLALPGKVPLFEERGAGHAAAPVYAVAAAAAGRRILFAPSCAALSADVVATLSGADVLLFDGTVFNDDEMVEAGVGRKTGARMGHVAMAGPDGSLAALAHVPGRKVFIHINNTNPVLLPASAERRRAEHAGFEIAFDGMEIDL